MVFKFVVLSCVLAAANAGLIAAPAATSYSSSAISHGHGLAYAAPVAHAAYAAPVAHLSYAAPAIKVAAPVAYAAPIHKTVVTDYHAPAHYDFEYGVHDAHTGDVKSQKESREGDVVHGSYSLVEPDGSKRTVEYTADPHNGFNAVVHRTPGAHPVAVKAVAPIVKAIAPVATYAHAPIATVAHVAHAPVATVSHVAHVAHAPVAHYAAPVAHYSYAAPALYHH